MSDSRKEKPDLRRKNLIQLCIYKWEFLRRWKEYRKDYETYAEDPEGFEAFTVYDPPLQEGETEQEWARRARKGARITSRANLLREKYGMEYSAAILPPDFKLDIKTSWPFFSYTGVTPFTEGLETSTYAISFLTNRQPYELILKIDVRHLNVDLNLGIEKYINLKRKELKWTPPNRRQLKLYKSYLDIWDLHLEGKTFEVIGRKLGLKRDAVQKRHKAVKALIEGGYKNIT